MYKIIGGDGNEYGPVSAETIRQWIAENRVNGETKVRSETGDWQPLAAFPEFATAFGGPAQPQPQAEAAGAGGAPAPFPTAAKEEIFEGDYQLDISGCLSRGWVLLKANFGTLFGGFMIYLALEFAVAIFGAIPVIGMVFTLANWVIAGPLMGGLLYLYLRVLRCEAASANDVFEGFRRSFGQLFLGELVKGLLCLACLTPAAVAAAIILLPSFLQHKTPVMTQWVMVGGVGLLCFVPMIYFTVNWMFTLPLILDKNLEFWPAMKLSWQRVNAHWWQCFGLMLMMGLLNLVGVLMCLVGLFITVPVGFAAMMDAYEIIFSGVKHDSA